MSSLSARIKARAAAKQAAPVPVAEEKVVEPKKAPAPEKKKGIFSRKKK